MSILQGMDPAIEAMASRCLEEVGGDTAMAQELLYQRLDEGQKVQLLSGYLNRALFALSKRLQGVAKQERRSEATTPAQGMTTVMMRVQGDVHDPEAVGTMIEGVNQEIKKNDNVPSSYGVMGLARMAEHAAISLMDDFRLSTGKSLGDASARELLEDATVEYQQAGRHLERSLFLKAVARHVGSAARVRNVLSNGEVAKLARLASEEVSS